MGIITLNAFRSYFRFDRVNLILLIINRLGTSMLYDHTFYFIFSSQHSRNFRIVCLYFSQLNEEPCILLVVKMKLWSEMLHMNTIIKLCYLERKF